jgi:hypothetical protein
MRLCTLVGLLVASFGLAACSGAMGVAPGDAVVSPDLGSPEVSIVVLAADDLVRLDADVRADGATLPVGPDGNPLMAWPNAPVVVDVAAPGFQPWTFTVEAYPDNGKIEFRLEPVVLSGLVTTDDGRPLPGATVSLGNAQDTTDNEGRYSLERAVPGTIELTRPAWERTEYTWDGTVAEYDMAMTPMRVRALRASADDIVDGGRWQSILSLADATNVNGVVIDLKTEDGTVVYATEVEVANAIGAVSSYFDVRAVLDEAKDHDLYTIGRIGVFQDDFYAAAEPDSAVLDEAGSLWRSRNGFAWLDPTDASSYEYSIALAEEACRLGFDEIQFDYVSFPFGGDVSTATFDGAYNQEVRVASIASYLTRAYAVLHPMRCAVSSTLLGIVLESSADEGVGQRAGTMSRIVDVLAPTLYTTNYGKGWKGFDDPNAHATEIVGTAYAAGRGKLDGHGYLRPWLQTWTISAADQRAVQSEMTEAGSGWQLWSNNTGYSADALPPR